MNTPVQRWQPEADEFARCLRLADLAGHLRKALLVPPGARALLVLNGESQELGPGEHEIESFFQRINHFWRDGQAEILLARSAPFALDFSLPALPSAEWLELDLDLRLQLRLESISVFARHFLLQGGAADGRIPAAELQVLCLPALRQAAAEALAGYSLPELGCHTALREQLEEALSARLTPLLAQYGLALFALEVAQLSHPAQRARQEQQHALQLAETEQRQRLQLLSSEARSKLQWQQEFDAIYDAQRWATIQREQRALQQQLQDQAMRDNLQLQHQQGQQQHQTESALQHQECMLALRARRIALLGRVLEADNEEAAMRSGAHEALRELQHEHAELAVQRLDNVRRWQHLQQLAQIRMQAEYQLAQHHCRSELALQRQRFAATLLQMRGERALQQEQGALQLQALRLRARLQSEQQILQARVAQQEMQAQLAMAEQEQAIRREQLQQQARWQQALAATETEVSCERLRQHLAVEHSAQQHDKLRATLALQDEFEARRQQRAWQQQQASVQLAQEQAALRDNQEEQQWRRRQQSELLAQRQQQEAELARMRTFATLPLEAQLAFTPAENAQLLAQLLQTRLHATMQPEQIAASSKPQAAAWTVLHNNGTGKPAGGE